MESSENGRWQDTEHPTSQEGSKKERKDMIMDKWDVEQRLRQVRKRKDEIDRKGKENGERKKEINNTKPGKTQPPKKRNTRVKNTMNVKE